MASDPADPYGRLVTRLRELEEVRAPNGVICGAAATRIEELEGVLRAVRLAAHRALPGEHDD